MVNLHSCAPPSASQIRWRALRHPRVALLSAYLLALKYAKPIHTHMYTLVGGICAERIESHTQHASECTRPGARELERPCCWICLFSGFRAAPICNSPLGRACSQRGSSMYKNVRRKRALAFSWYTENSSIPQTCKDGAYVIAIWRIGCVCVLGCKYIRQ
jgi:hypothetical protein